MIEINLSLKPILDAFWSLWNQFFAPILHQVVDFIINKSGLSEEAVIKMLLWTTALALILALTAFIVKQIKEIKY